MSEVECEGWAFNKAVFTIPLQSQQVWENQPEKYCRHFKNHALAVLVDLTENMGTMASIASDQK